MTANEALDGIGFETGSASRHLIDPELAALIEALPPINLSAETLADLRSRQFPMPEPSEAARGIETIDRRVPGPKDAPDVRVVIFRPRGASAALPVILHIHGGGYVAGSVETSDVRQREMSAALNCAIVSVDYRLAPETVFPGAVEDCYAALAWVVANGADNGFDPRRIILKGESAGGGLAAALALLTRDRGEFSPIHQHLTYPMLDDRTGTTRAAHPYAGEFVWMRGDNLFGWSSLLGGPPGAPDVSPYAAAARATDLSGLPPAFIMSGALDLFAEDCTDYARRLIQAGVPTELHIYPGGFHGFDRAPDAKIAVAARASSLAALSRAMRPGE